MLGQLGAGERLADAVVADVGDLDQAVEQAERLENAGIDADADVGVAGFDSLERDVKARWGLRRSQLLNPSTWAPKKRSRSSTLLPCFRFCFHFDMSPPWLDWRLKHTDVCIGPSTWRHDKAYYPQAIGVRSGAGRSLWREIPQRRRSNPGLKRERAAHCIDQDCNIVTAGPEQSHGIVKRIFGSVTSTNLGAVDPRWDPFQELCTARAF